MEHIDVFRQDYYKKFIFSTGRMKPLFLPLFFLQTGLPLATTVDTTPPPTPTTITAAEWPTVVINHHVYSENR